MANYYYKRQMYKNQMKKTSNIWSEIGQMGKRKIICDGIIYESIKAASEELGISRTSIIDSAKSDGEKLRCGKSFKYF